MLTGEFFDKLASNRDKGNIDKNKLKFLLDKINISLNDTILDVGCGTGILEEELFLRSKNKVLSVDISKNMIDIAKNKYKDNKNIEFINCDFLNLNINKTFTKIILFNTYPHIIDVNKLKEKAFDLLNKDGELIIMHSLSKETLKKHHDNVPKNLYFEINNLDEEINKFTNKFSLIKKEDTETYFYFILKKEN